MGYFADTVSSYFKSLGSFYENTYYPALQRYTKYVAPQLSISSDSCNFVVTYKPPLTAGEIGIANIGLFNLPRITAIGRNPFCQPPPPPPPGAHKLPRICNCGAIITFGCTVTNDSPNDFTSSPGMGFLSYIVNGQPPPEGVLEFNYRYGNPFAVSADIPTVYVMNGFLNGKTLSVYYCSIIVSKEDQKNGYINVKLADTPNGKKINWGVVNVDCIGCEPQAIVDPPPPPKECCMCCCNDNANNNDALLKLILKRIGNLPATVPNNIADSNNKGTHSIESLAEMIFWHVKQMDAISGQYPIPITIKADPTDKDSKEQHLSLPNQAETLAEILGLLITTKRDTHANLIATIKGMTEAGMTKNIATQTLDVALANAEFLGYKLDHMKRSIPIAFTPGGKNVAEVLKPTSIDIISYENKDTTDLQDDLKKLLTMAARWNAQNWRALGHDAAKSLRNNLIEKPQTSIDTHNALKEETFAQFIKEAQVGFTTKPGVTDSTDPWGNPESEAPIIREIGTAADVTDANKNSTTPQTSADKNSIINAGNVQKISTILKSL